MAMLFASMEAGEAGLGGLEFLWAMNYLLLDFKYSIYSAFSLLQRM